jgi:hypothetical protein
MRFLLVLERLEPILKRRRPKFFSAGPPAALDLAFPWISITGKEMLTILSIVLLKSFCCVIKKQIVEVFRNPQSYQKSQKG